MKTFDEILARASLSDTARDIIEPRKENMMKTLDEILRGKPRVAADWNEDDHPRGDDGKFSPGGGGGGGGSKGGGGSVSTGGPTGTGSVMMESLMGSTGETYLSGHKSIDVAESHGFKLDSAETEQGGDVAIHHFKDTKGNELDLFTAGLEVGAQSRVGKNVEWFLTDAKGQEQQGIGTASLRKAMRDVGRKNASLDEIAFGRPRQ
jgi:hypothetical protein